ncbi:Isochorismatase family protein [Penicillium malachiteum]|uniref:Isochorismatase family protein n=1 Tax=Penicillium malachiteum TaxID=1324776 RepID=A0AAD6MR78_9EURO|nr:Isochorismatase family protein [Penicillium malachiteum]
MGTTTLLILDIQNGVIDQLENTDSYLSGLAEALSTARNNSIKVIHVITAFRHGYPENHPNNSSVPAVAARGQYKEGDFSVQVHSKVAPTPEEPIITKRRVSAFFGTELDMILRCSNTDHLVVAGLITSGAVLSTVRQAMDLDYRITVLRDLCMDRDEEVHRVLMDKVFQRKTTVISAQEWISQVNDAA